MSSPPDPPVAPAFDRDRDLAELISLEADLAGVEIALRRLDDGTYATCEVCRTPIPARVAADPLARRCEDHAEASTPDGLWSSAG